jgi:hypothetical protein
VRLHHELHFIDARKNAQGKGNVYVDNVAER